MLNHAFYNSKPFKLFLKEHKRPHFVEGKVRSVDRYHHRRSAGLLVRKLHLIATSRSL